jgi:hypothetical protein
MHSRMARMRSTIRFPCSTFRHGPRVFPYSGSSAICTRLADNISHEPNKHLQKSLQFPGLSAPQPRFDERRLTAKAKTKVRG